MRVQNKRLVAAGICLSALLGGAGSSSSYAQDASTQKKTPDVRVERNVVIERDGVVIEGHEPPEGMIGVPGPRGTIRSRAHPGDNTFVFVASEMSFNGKLVKGAPYSAEVVTEMTQTLPDGNRIVNKNTANVYRDSEGRTRREQTLSAIGPFAVNGDPPQTFFINDPVAGVNYILDPRTHTARKLPMPPLGSKMKTAVAPLPPPPPGKDGKSKEREEFFTMAVPAPPVADGVQMFRYSQKNEENARKESLGTKSVEGVQAEGTRMTVTIPAGEIGNEQPINIVTERWYSPELQVVVMSRHSDPRSGETVYRLTNINRSEPARTLFEVPSDYTLKEMPRPQVRTFMRTPKDDK